MASDDRFKDATARPWAAQHHPKFSDSAIVVDAGGEHVLADFLSKANAALIVHCVNTHDALISALRTWGKCRACDGDGYLHDAVESPRVNCGLCNGEGYPPEVWALLEGEVRE